MNRRKKLVLDLDLGGLDLLRPKSDINIIMGACL